MSLVEILHNLSNISVNVVPYVGMAVLALVGVGFSKLMLYSPPRKRRTVKK